MPNRTTALALVRHWSIIRIGSFTPPELATWNIISREFRENVEWAILVPGEGEVSTAVAVLLAELRALRFSAVKEETLNTAAKRREQRNPKTIVLARQFVVGLHKCLELS